MVKLSVCVLFGGMSPEHEVSLRSAEYVLNSLNPEKYNVFPVGITKDGDWVLFGSKDYSLLPSGDFVALSLPHSPSTTGLMNKTRLKSMKQDAVLINAGRGSVLDQDALAEELKSGHLWGAALDVTTPEPLPPEHPLWETPNLIITPHVAGGMRLDVTRKTCVQMSLDNLKRYLAGEPLHNLVT